MHDANAARPNYPRSFAALVGAWLLATVAATIAMAVVACSGGNLADRDLVVTSYSPTRSAEGDAPLRVQFDHPVVGADAVGRPVAAPPVVLEPAAAVRAHWADRQTLVVLPAVPLRPSTRYKLALTGDLARRTGGFSLTFVNRPLEVEAISGVDLRRLPPQPSLPIQFNQEVAVDDVIAHCSIRGDVGAPPTALVTDEPAGDSAATVEVRPTTTLAQGTDYSLVCDGLTGAGGDAPIAEAYSAYLHTYPALSVAKVGPDGYDVPADEVDFQIHLSTPVSLDAIRKALKIHPAITGFDNGWLDKTGTVYRVTADLKTTTAYELTLKKGLTDIYGQKLAANSVHSFHTGDAKPRLVVQTGIYAVEPATGGYPVWTRNVKKFAVSCAAVPAKQVVKLLTSSMDYDPWYDAEDTTVSWQKLGLKKHDRTVSIDQPKNKWHLSRVDLRDTCGGSRARGLYLAAMSSPDVAKDPDEPWRFHPSRRILANVTDLGILTKAGTASGLVWVASISTGKPVSGAKVNVYTPQGRLTFRGTTDKHGILRTPGTTTLLRQPGARDKDDFEEDPEEDFWSYRSQRLIVVVEHAGDMGVVDGNWANGIQTWNFGVPEDRRSGDTRIRGFIQSDRGIYRPGETVHFKGIVRDIAVGKAPVVPRKSRVAITVEDARGQSLYTAKKKLSRFGGFYFDLPLPEAASLGDYYVRATIKGQTFHERFSVEEFRKVTYELKLRGAKRQARLGDKLAFNLDADYLFGAPVAGAKVIWSVERRTHYLSFARYPEFGFADWAARGDDYWSRWDHSSYSSYLTDGEGRTDAKGAMKIRVRDPQIEFDGPQDYILNAQVTDETDQTVSKTTVVTAHKTDFYLGLHTQEFVQAVGMPFSVNVVALSPEGKPVATKAKLSLIRQDYQCTYSDGYRAHRTCKAVHKVALERDIDVSATGVDTERIMPEHPGEYFIRVETVDSHGNAVASSDYVWILGKGEAFWSGDESARMSLIASKREYQPGDTARLVPRTGLKDATALVTLERNGILDARVVHLARASEGISIPLTGAHAPNVFATVAMVTGRTGPGDAKRPRFKMGVVDLQVSPDAHRLKVDIATERGEYRPGDDVEGTITVTYGGKPVAAEVSLSVADEGVLQLIAYKTPDPMKSFFASWGMGIDNSTNWNRIARLDDPTVIDPDEGGDSGGDGDPGVRSRFVQSAYWAPALITDEHGKISFHFRAPDNLTAFRLMAVAADDGTRFGSGDRRITVKKPLLLEPVLPRFLTSGDAAEVGVVVRNYTGTAGTARVTARARGAGIHGRTTKRVKVADGGSARVRFQISAADVDSARFTFKASMGGERDALALTVPIDRGLVPETRSLARGAIAADAPVTVPATWRSDSVGDASTLSITVDRTGLADLEPSLRYLIEYPYGCLEQTLSRFIPLTKVKDLASSLGMKSLKGPKLRAYIRAGAAKVVRHQHANGHYSLWPSGPTYPHLTVYATYGLLEAKRAGVKVDDDAIDRGLAAIRTWANAPQRTLGPGGETATVAMAAYVLAEAGKPDHGLNARLFDARAALPRYGQAFLLRAMVRAKAPSDPSTSSGLRTLEGELIAAMQPTGHGLVVRESMSDGYYYMSSDARSTAIALSALLEFDPQAVQIPQLVDGLKQLRSSSGRWSNTQDNLYALVALADYARTKANGAAQVTMTAGGQTLTRTIKGGAVLSFSRHLDQLKPGTVTIRADGPVRYAVQLTEARRDSAAVSIDNGFHVDRRYVAPDTGKPITELHAGQLVRVVVGVSSLTQRNWVAVEDHLPAGFEAVNTKLATSQQASATRRSRRYGNGYYRYTYGWTHIELHDDRVLAFADRMRGRLELTYLARATLPGTFQALPARAEEMYAPATNGRSAARKVTVQK